MSQRIPAAREGTDPELDELLRALRERGVHVSNLAMLLGRRPTLMKAMNGYSTALASATTVDPLLRELAILRTAVLTACPYAWTHHAPKAVAAGLDVGALAALGVDADRSTLTSLQAAVLDTTDLVDAARPLTDGAYDELRGHLTEEEVLELVMVATFYGALSRLVANFSVPIDEDRAAWLDHWPAAHGGRGATG